MKQKRMNILISLLVAVLPMVVRAENLLCQGENNIKNSEKQKIAQELKKGNQNDVFFAFMVSKEGEPKKCTLELNEEVFSIRYEFAKGWGYELHSGPFSEERVARPARTLFEEEAFDLLKGEHMQRATLGPPCKIKWKNPKIEKGEDRGTQKKVFKCPGKQSDTSLSVVRDKKTKKILMLRYSYSN